MKPNFLRALKAHARKAWQEVKRPEVSLDDLMQRVRNAVRKEFKRPTDKAVGRIYYDKDDSYAIAGIF